MTREELVKDIKAIMTEKPRLETVEGTANVIADFIIKDRQRVVAPLISLIEDAKFYKEQVDIRIIQTLQNAGIDTDK